MYTHITLPACSAIVIAASFISETAHAQTPPGAPLPVAPEQPRMESTFLGPSIWGTAVGEKAMKSIPRWYGWQTMVPLAVMDIATLSAWISLKANGATAADSEAFRVFQVGVIPVHTLAGPIVHWANGHVRQGFVSFGMHLAMAYLTLFPLTWAGVSTNNSTYFDIAPVFSVVGVLAANTIDIAYLSHDKEQVPLYQRHDARGLVPSSIALMPMVNAQQQGLALIGQF